EPLHAARDQVLLERQVTDVADLGEDLPALGLDLLDGRGEVFLGRGRGPHVLRRCGAQVQTDDLGALAGEPDRVLAGVAARDARDVDDLAVDISHVGGTLFSSDVVVGNRRVTRRGGG